MRGRRLPHESDFFRSEAVGLVDEVGESAFERERFGGLGAGRLDRASVHFRIDTLFCVRPSGIPPSSSSSPALAF